MLSLYSNLAMSRKNRISRTITKGKISKLRLAWPPKPVFLVSPDVSERIIPPGPYFMIGSELHQAWRIYPDKLNAFMTAYHDPMTQIQIDKNTKDQATDSISNDANTDEDSNLSLAWMSLEKQWSCCSQPFVRPSLERPTTCRQTYCNKRQHATGRRKDNAE